MMTSPPESRVRFVRLVTVVWLALISTLVIVDHVRSWRWSQEDKAGARRIQIMALEERLSALEHGLDAVRREPPSVSQSTFTAAQRELDTRLVRIEQVIADAAHQSDLASLLDRLSTIEARVVSVRPTPNRSPVPARRSTSTPAEGNAKEPPFTLPGTELRGGERFLCLAPAGTRTLSEVRVLRPGETQGDWRLEALDGKAAEFRIDGRMQRIELP